MTQPSVDRNGSTPIGRRGARCLPAGTRILEPGQHTAETLTAELERGFGLLILSGCVAIELEADQGHAAWLVGANDLVRPWEMSEFSLIRGARWRVLTRTCVVPLGRRFYQQAQRNPGVLEAALSCATRTSHWLFAKTVILSRPHMVDRILLLFALWAERWGIVTPDGVRLDLPLTHQLIGNCCGARRPTTTSALRLLATQGYVTRVSHDSWLLHRDPPNHDGCRCRKQYMDVLGLDALDAKTVA